MVAMAVLIGDLVAAGRILGRQGVVDAFGHVSARHPDRDDLFLMSRSMAPASVTADDVLELNLDAVVTRGAGKTFVERFIHAEIYRVRPDVGAIVHSHSPAVIPFGVTPAPLRPVYHMSSFLPDPVPVFDIQDAAGDTDLLIRNATLGRALAESLGHSCAVLQRGHGSTVVGDDVREAVFRAVYLENNARIVSAAMALGPVTFLTQGEAALADAATRPQIDRAWDLWVAALDHEGR